MDAEIVEMMHGNHVFLVIGRKPGSNLQDPASWGDDAYICDSLERTVYKAKDYQDRLKAYLNPFIFHIMKGKEKMGEFYVLGLRDAKPEDPSTWPPDVCVCDREKMVLCLI